MIYMANVNLCKIRPTIVASFVAAWLLFLVDMQSVRGGFVLSMSQDGSNPTFQVRTGEQSINIPVYLIQTQGENRLSSTGLFAGGATITFQTGGGKATYVNGSGQYSSHWVDTVASSATFLSPDLRIQGLVTTTPVRAAAGTNFIQIGSFRVTGGDPGSITTLSLSLQGLVGDPILLDDLTAILPNAPSPSNRVIFGTTTISAVPEPSSILLIGSTIGCVWALRRRQYRYR